MAKAKKLPSGNWRVQLFVGMEGGKRKYKSFTAETRKEAEYKAARYAATKQEDNKSNITIGKATEKYIESKKNILSPSTIKGYKNILKNYFTDIADVKIKDVTQEFVQSSVNDFAATHGSKTCRNFHGLLSAVLKIHRPEMILRTTLPQKNQKDIYVPDPQEVTEISKLTVGTAVYIPFLLATQCGLRASEISGLEIKDVYPDYIKIKQARVDGEVNGKRGNFLKQPKSNSGYRKVPIDKDLYTILIENADGERVCRYSSGLISSYWGKFKSKNNLNKSLNFHALRHHFASKCLLLGMPQRYIAELMGHRDTTMIEKVYQHTFPSIMEGYANKLRQYGNDFLKNTTRNGNATQDAT